jgi:hypothetical protein
MRTSSVVSGENISFSPVNVLKIFSAMGTKSSYGTIWFLQANSALFA